jgi:hypothetical protein
MGERAASLYNKLRPASFSMGGELPLTQTEASKLFFGGASWLYHNLGLASFSSRGPSCFYHKLGLASFLWGASCLSLPQTGASKLFYGGASCLYNKLGASKLFYGGASGHYIQQIRASKLFNRGSEQPQTGAC